ncbi:MAG: hypothetical protein ACLSFC_05130 [Enterocloster bolteae]
MGKATTVTVIGGRHSYFHGGLPDHPGTRVTVCDEKWHGARLKAIRKQEMKWI